MTQPARTVAMISTAMAIERMLEAQKGRHVLSMSDAVKAVRSIVPDCELEDGELADLIALHAVAQGVEALDFNLLAKLHETQRVDG